ERHPGGVDTLIGHWLGARHDVIVDYCALSGMQARRPHGASATNTRLQRFCQQLVDYVSSGHFEMYYELLREAETVGDDCAEQAGALLPAIVDSTPQLLDFNDCYAEAATATDAAQLARDLSHL